MKVPFFLSKLLFFFILQLNLCACGLGLLLNVHVTSASLWRQAYGTTLPLPVWVYAFDSASSVAPQTSTILAVHQENKLMLVIRTES